MEIISADGTRLAARRTGRGEPLVLVHGSAGGLDSFDPVVPLLTDAFEVWVYERRGYAPGAGEPALFAGDVADLRAVLQRSGPARVAGVSYGATVGLHAALESGAGIRTLTVFEPPLFAAGVVGALKRFRAALTAGDLLAANRIFAAEVARFPFADQLGPADPGETTGMLHDLEALAADGPDIDRWSGIRVPIRIVQGGDTWAPMPETMDALAAACPAAERVTLDGQSHFAAHTAPELFAAAIR